MLGKEVAASSEDVLQDEVGASGASQQEASAKQKEDGDLTDEAGAHHPEPGNDGGRVRRLEGQLKEVACERGDKRVVTAHPLRTGRVRIGEGKLPAFSVIARQGQPDRLRKLCESAQRECLVWGRLHLATESLDGCGDELPDSRLVAEDAVTSSQFLHDRFGLELVLGEAGAPDALALGVLVPTLQKLFGSVGAKGECQLCLAWALKDAVHKEFGQPALIFGDGDIGPQLASDLVRLLDQDGDHFSVDGVIASVQAHHSDARARLAKAVDAPFTLLETVWVPGQVVVEDSVEQFLEVDALAETICRDQDTLWILSELTHALVPLFVAEAASDAGDAEIRKFCVERWAEQLGNVFGGVDKEAPDNGV